MIRTSIQRIFELGFINRDCFLCPPSRPWFASAAKVRLPPNRDLESTKDLPAKRAFVKILIHFSPPYTSILPPSSWNGGRPPIVCEAGFVSVLALDHLAGDRNINPRIRVEDIKHIEIAQVLIPTPGNPIAHTAIGSSFPDE